MSKTPIATVRPVEESEATGRVEEIFADIRETKQIGFIPNFWRVLATQPDLLDQVWSQLKQVMHPESVGREAQLDTLTRELIALAVSATNGCGYCINSHTAAAMKLGLDEQGLGEVMAIVGLFNQTNSLADGYQVDPDVRPRVE